MMTLPRVGDRVTVEFGGRDKEAEVVHVSATPPMVEVAIRLEGGEEPVRFTYRAERVRPARHH